MNLRRMVVIHKDLDNGVDNRHYNHDGKSINNILDNGNWILDVKRITVVNLELIHALWLVHKNTSHLIRPRR